jgi:hypothetical protein
MFTPAKDFLLETPWRIIIPNPNDVYSMLGLALPKPKRSNRSSGLIRNGSLKQMIIDNS